MSKRDEGRGRKELAVAFVLALLVVAFLTLLAGAERTVHLTPPPIHTEQPSR